MAPSNRGGAASFQSRRFPSGPHDRPIYPPNPSFHPPSSFHPFNAGQDPMAYPVQHNAGHVGFPMDNVLQPTAHPRPGTHEFHYPNGIPDDYKLAPTQKGEIRRRYVDTLDEAFYMKRSDEVKAIFSTNDGQITARGLSLGTFTAFRELDLWTAEDIQANANAVRKKHWRLMKNMQKPEYWMDLYDYFEPYEVYYHGAINIWNLVFHLYLENRELLKTSQNYFAFEVGFWCDEWLSWSENKKKLDVFGGWESPSSLFNAQELKQIRHLPSYNADHEEAILRSALLHRRDQMHLRPRSRPAVFPQNTLKYHWEYYIVERWLAGQPVPDTPSGLHPVGPSLSRSATHSVASVPRPSSGSNGLASINESPAKAGSGSQTPVVVDGTNKQGPGVPRPNDSLGGTTAATQHPDGFAGKGGNAVALDDTTTNGRSRNVRDSHPAFATPAGSSGSPPTEPPMCYVDPKDPAYNHPPRPRMHLSNPYSTGPGEVPQPYPGHIAPPMPGQQPQGHTSQNNATPWPPAQERFSIAMDDFRESTSHSRHHQFNNGKQQSAMDTASGPRTFGWTPTRVGTSHESRNEPVKTASAFISTNQAQPPQVWEKVQNAEDSIHGPTFRRSSPTKERRARASSSSTDSNCPNRRYPHGDLWSYAPCNCMRCEQRERTVWVTLTPNPLQRHAWEIVHQTITGRLSEWGFVENVSAPLTDKENPKHLSVMVRFAEGSHVVEAATTAQIFHHRLDCSVKIKPCSHTKYGSVLNSTAGGPGTGGGSETWRDPSTTFKNRRMSFGQGQHSSYHRGSRAQASLEQYMLARQPHAAEALSQSAPGNDQLMGSYEKAGLTSNLTTSSRTSVKPTAILRPSSNDPQPQSTIGKVVQASAEAEAQSKPPSEEVLPGHETSEKPESTEDVEGSDSKVGGKPIRVNLPTTPQKKHESSPNISEGSPMPVNKVDATSQNSDLFVTPTKHKVQRTPHDETAFEEVLPSSTQKQPQSATVTPPKMPFPSQAAKDPTSEKPLTSKENVTEQTLAPKSPISESPKYGKGKYRQVLTEHNVERVDLFDMNNSRRIGSLGTQADARPQPFRFNFLTDEQVREMAGHDFDKTLDAKIATESRDQSQDVLQTAAATEGSSKKKGKNKNKKKKKKADSSVQVEDGSSKQPAHEDDRQVLAGLTDDKKAAPAEVVEPDPPSEKSETEEPGSKDFRANAGGSLRVPKNRKKQPAGLNIASFPPGTSAGDVINTGSPQPFDVSLPSAAIFVTAKDHTSSDGSQGMASTPATPPSGDDTTPKTTPPNKAAATAATLATPKFVQLNPEAKAFFSPAPRPLQPKLAPIPLRPEHQRKLSQSSGTTSRTVTPGNSPTKKSTGDASVVKETSKDVKQEVHTAHDSQHVPADDAPKEQKTELQPGKQHDPEGAADEGSDWQVQGPRRILSKNKPNQSKGKNQPQQTQTQGKKGPKKNRFSPTKQRVQSQSDAQPRHVSNRNNQTVPLSNRDNLPSLSMASAPQGLPKSAVWGRAQSMSLAATPNTASSVAAKADAPGNPRPTEDGGEH